MNKIKRSAGCAADSTSIDASRKSFITVLARVLARDLELAPPTKKKKKGKRNSSKVLEVSNSPATILEREFENEEKYHALRFCLYAFQF